MEARKLRGSRETQMGRQVPLYFTDDDIHLGGAAGLANIFDAFVEAKGSKEQGQSVEIARLCEDSHSTWYIFDWSL